jgi:tryptophanyl-tRNA synthetase
LTERQRVFSGIQPTGDIHIGNYLGAVRNWARNQDDLESFFCIVDLHAMTLPWDPATLRTRSVETGALLLACGIDPARSTLFIQSDVREHSELAWVLTCIARMGELRRMVQFKEKSKGDSESVGAGVLTYPVLQAADVLLYRAHGVPVGEDQRQHIELMRDLALRFNTQFGDTFVVPEPWVPKAGARIMALDDPTQKMSKSAPRPASKILLTDAPDKIVKKIRSAVTDSGSEVRAAQDKPAITNLLTIFSVIEGVPVPELEERFAGSGYGDFKNALANSVVTWLTPLRTRYEELLADRGRTEDILTEGAEKARGVASEVMAAVRDRVGLV